MWASNGLRSSLAQNFASSDILLIMAYLHHSSAWVVREHGKHSANYYRVCPGIPLKTTHLQKRAWSIRNCEIQTSRVLKTHTGTYALHFVEIDATRQPTLSPCGQQFPIWVGGGERPTFRTACAQRGHNARCTPLHLAGAIFHLFSDLETHCPWIGSPSSGENVFIIQINILI